jgi:predicted DNA binding CopG/RHH family protein
MRKEYDFSRMIGKKNPHVKRLKKQVTIRLGIEAIEYFKEMSEVTGIPYQSLINSYLTDCARNQRKLVVNWS